MKTDETGENGRLERNRCRTTGKVCYTRKEAGARLNDAVRRHFGGRTNKNVPKRMYWCEHCGFYHLTHYKKEKRWRRRRGD